MNNIKTIKMEIRKTKGLITEFIYGYEYNKPSDMSWDEIIPVWKKLQEELLDLMDQDGTYEWRGMYEVIKESFAHSDIVNAYIRIDKCLKMLEEHKITM